MLYSFAFSTQNIANIKFELDKKNDDMFLFINKFITSQSPWQYGKCLICTKYISKTNFWQIKINL